MENNTYRGRPTKMSQLTNVRSLASEVLGVDVDWVMDSTKNNYLVDDNGRRVDTMVVAKAESNGIDITNYSICPTSTARGIRYRNKTPTEINSELVGNVSEWRKLFLDMKNGTKRGASRFNILSAARDLAINTLNVAPNRVRWSNKASTKSNTLLLDGVPICNATTPKATFDYVQTMTNPIELLKKLNAPVKTSSIAKRGRNTGSRLSRGAYTQVWYGKDIQSALDHIKLKHGLESDADAFRVAVLKYGSI